MAGPWDHNVKYMKILDTNRDDLHRSEREMSHTIRFNIENLEYKSSFQNLEYQGFLVQGLHRMYLFVELELPTETDYF